MTIGDTAGKEEITSAIATFIEAALDRQPAQRAGAEGEYGDVEEVQGDVAARDARGIHVSYNPSRAPRYRARKNEGLGYLNPLGVTRPASLLFPAPLSTSTTLANLCAHPPQPHSGVSRCQRGAGVRQAKDAGRKGGVKDGIGGKRGKRRMT